MSVMRWSVVFRLMSTVRSAALGVLLPQFL
jgi:hypothetical protein